MSVDGCSLPSDTRQRLIQPLDGLRCSCLWIGDLVVMCVADWFFGGVRSLHHSRVFLGNWCLVRLPFPPAGWGFCGGGHLSRILYVAVTPCSSSPSSPHERRHPYLDTRRHMVIVHALDARPHLRSGDAGKARVTASSSSSISSSCVEFCVELRHAAT